MPDLDFEAMMILSTVKIHCSSFFDLTDRLIIFVYTTKKVILFVAFVWFFFSVQMANYN